MAGPAYDFDRRNPSRIKWPQQYDSVPLFFEWTRDYFKAFHLNRPHGNRLEALAAGARCGKRSQTAAAIRS